MSRRRQELAELWPDVCRRESIGWYMYDNHCNRGGLRFSGAVFVGAPGLGTERLEFFSACLYWSTLESCDPTRIGMREMHAARNISLISVPPAVEATVSTEGQVSLGLSYFLTVFSTLMVILRFWSRKLSRFGIGLDDWLALATLVLLYFVLALSVVLVYEGGVGKPMPQAVREQPMAPVTSLKVSQVSML